MHARFIDKAANPKPQGEVNLTFSAALATASPHTRMQLRGRMSSVFNAHMFDQRTAME
jgi:hypothetical protein